MSTLKDVKEPFKITIDDFEINLGLFTTVRYDGFKLVSLSDVSTYLKSLKIGEFELDKLIDNQPTLIIIFKLPEVRLTRKHFSYRYKLKKAVERISSAIPITCSVMTNLDKEWI